ncbi:MAG: ATPase [Bacteroidales bacterium]|nr:ATPase [Bacteroidales bacterium]
MILIVDAGSTKADWCLIDGKKIIMETATKGFNPYYYESSYLEDEIKKCVLPLLSSANVEKIYYYGSGCSTENKCIIIENVLRVFFKNAEIFVAHDLLGAARALCGNYEGIACILGTGSNSCYYDGEKVVENVPSVGYMFGDHGSGTYLGKLLLRAYLLNEMPENIIKIFEKEYNYSLEEILDHLYNKPNPNKFLSQFSYFCNQNIGDDFINNLIRINFNDFFKYQVSRYSKYKEVQICSLGSVGYFFRDFLDGVAEEWGVNIKKNIKTPIEGLIEYHKNNF